MKTFLYQDLKNYTEDELKELSNDIRKEIINACSKNGGHLGSSLGVIEAIVAMHASFDFPKDKVIFDVGHQSYAHKILSGRSLESLRKLGGISGFQKMSESEFDPYEAGHSSTSISAAMGMAYARDLSGDNYQVIAFIGDAAISNGLTFEALNQIEDFDKKIIIILNDNNMSISSTNGAFHKSFANKNENIFANLGIDFIGPIDGYDFNELKKAYEIAKNAKRSVVIDVLTTKGRGYIYSEMDDDGFWHGVEPFSVETGKPLTKEKEGYASWSKAYAEGLEKTMEKDEKSIIITPATILGSSLRSIMKKYPERAFDVGISEEHAVVLANALALGSYHPFVSMYSTFLQRAYDEILHDNARMNSQVTYLIDRAGLVGPDGETHQGIYDVAMLLSIPNVSIAMARNQKQAMELLNFSRKFTSPLFIRYPKSSIPYDKDLLVEEKGTLEYGKWEVVKNENKDTCLITMGDKVDMFLDEDITLINACWLNPIDKDVLNSILSYKKVIIYDPYSTVTGFAKMVENYLLANGYKGVLITKAIPNTFIAQGTIAEQEKMLSLSKEDIVKLLK